MQVRGCADSPELVQLQFFFDLRPRDAGFAAVGPFGSFNAPGVLDVFHRPAHLAQQGLGLGDLLVELRPVARRLGGGQNGVTYFRASLRRLLLFLTGCYACSGHGTMPAFWISTRGGISA